MEQKKTKHTFEYDEEINMRKMELVLDNWEALENKIGYCYDLQTHKRLDSNASLTIYRSFFNMKLKTNKVTYNFGKKNRKLQEGRLFADGSKALQGLSRILRHTVGGEIYWDIDIKNAHPVILMKLCGDLGLEYNHIKYYNDNRDECLAELMNCVSHTDDLLTEVEKIKREHSTETNELIEKRINTYIKDKCKYIPLTVLNGGKIKGLSQIPTWLLDYETQMGKIHDFFWKANPDIAKKVELDDIDEKKFNYRGKLLNKFLCKWEEIVLSAMIEYTENNGMKIGTNCFDGFLLYKNTLLEKDIPDYLEKCKNYVFEKLKFDVTLTCKPMTDGIDLTGYQTNKEKNLAKIDDKSYEYLKKKFELHFFKCISQSNFYHVQDRKIKTFSKTDLCTSYQHMKYSEISEKSGKTIERSFITKWLDDSEIRTYENVDTIIPPFVCPENTFNLWDGFDVEFMNITSDTTEGLQLILDHLKLLCNQNDELYNYLLRWIANIFQNPAKKNNIAVLFKSKEEGMGKNMFFEILQTMISNKYSASVNKPERDVFGTFNGILDNKILVLFDEFASKLGYTYSEELKQFITNTEIDISKKGIESQTKPNMMKVIFNTNNDFPIKIGTDDRRFVVADSSGQPVPTMEYFNKLSALKTNHSVLRAFFDTLMELDLDNYDWISNRPKTDAYNDMRLVSMDIELRFLINYINEKPSRFEIKCGSLFQEFQLFVSCENSDFRTNNIKFGIKIKNLRIDGLENHHTMHGNFYSLDIQKIKNWLTSKKFI